jgi:Mn-dependent DtxR family transcriptional regulator
METEMDYMEKADFCRKYFAVNKGRITQEAMAKKLKVSRGTLSQAINYFAAERLLDKMIKKVNRGKK